MTLAPIDSIRATARSEIGLLPDFSIPRHNAHRLRAVYVLMTPRQARPGREHSHQQPRRSLANTKVTCVRSLSSSLYKTPNVRGKDAVLATATKRASAGSAGQLLREVHNTVWGWQFVGVASLCPKQQFSKRLMRTGMRLQSGHSQKTAHTRPTPTMLLFPLSSTPHDLPGRRDFSQFTLPPRCCTVLLYCRVKRRPAS